jgi:uncharacterized membrane protein (DUF373 family)
VARFLHSFEKVIVIALIVMMAVVILSATAELGWTIVRDLASAPILRVGVDELLDIVGYILMIFIGLELLETIKAYLNEHAVHVEIVLEVALIAVARKVIVLNAKEYPGVTVLAIAALIVALAIAYYLEKTARTQT